MTSYVTDGTVGPWAKEKLDCLRKYLNAYTTILKEQSWCEGFIYVDAFAGAGKAPLRKYSREFDISLLDVAGYHQNEKEVEEYVYGSPRVALDTRFPFSEYIFNEMNPRLVNELNGLKQEHAGSRKITILQGDANEQLRDHLLGTNYNWKKYRGVVFIDPFGMQVPWKTLEEIGKTGALEIILNLPVGMAIQRLLPKNGIFTEEQKSRLTEYFGSSEWEDIVYEESTGLFGTEIIKKENSGKLLAKWYQKRLKDAFGFSTSPRLITNTNGTHLYYLLWAGPHPLGKKIAADVLKQGIAIK